MSTQGEDRLRQKPERVRLARPTAFLHDLLCGSSERSATNRLSLPFSSRDCRGSRNSLKPRLAYFFSIVEHSIADDVFAANLPDRGAALRLAQCPQDLLFAVAPHRHAHTLLTLLHRTTAQAALSTWCRDSFRVLGQSFSSRSLRFSREPKEERFRWLSAKCRRTVDQSKF